MERIRIIAILGLLASCALSYGQNPLQGVVQDGNGVPVFPAMVWVKSDPAHNTVTDFEGRFSLNFPREHADSLSFSCLGYKDLSVAISDLDGSQPVVIRMEEDVRMIESAYVVSSPSISSDFAVQRIDKYDIYSIPGANADPLKAISCSVHSTNVSETSNPEIRGSSGDYSRVVLNGVPVLKPVRNQQVNGLGNFSIFNVEMIDKEDVYAGSPPLKYGNSIGGLIDVTTKARLEENSCSVSASLASLGVQVSRIINPKSFVQVLGNYQFSGPYLYLNENPNNVHSFGSADAALNYRYTTGNCYLNVYSYFVDEKYASEYSLFNYTGDSEARKKRFFSIVNLGYRKGETSLELNGGIDHAKSFYTLSTLCENHREDNRYLSLNWLSRWLDGVLTTQAGAAYSYSGHVYDGTEPASYWRLDDPARVRELDLSTSMTSIELYTYLKYLPVRQLSLGVGLRKNIPLKGQDDFLSYQFSAKYTPANNHSILLSLGKYYGYSTPEYYFREIVGAHSFQCSLDYSAIWNRHLTTQFSVYGKGERLPVMVTGEAMAAVMDTKIYGAEASCAYYCNDNVDFSLSYSYIRSRIGKDGNYVDYYNDMPFMLKFGANLKTRIVNLSLNVIGKSGMRYTPLVGSRAIPGGSIPVFGEDYSERMGDYWTFDLALNRRFVFGDSFALILFSTINNVLNRRNPRYIYYDKDFNEELVRGYNGRAFYVGVRLDF